jgi:hypothetical protein
MPVENRITFLIESQLIYKRRAIDTQIFLKKRKMFDDRIMNELE